MIYRRILSRPLQSAGWREAAEGAIGVLADWAQVGSRALGRLAAGLAALIEPALDWLARQRWLGGLFRSLIGKIVALNLLGLLVLTSAILFFSPFQASFVQAKLEGMMAEGSAIAALIGSTATRESDRVVVNDDLLAPGQTAELKEAMTTRPLQFPIRPERVGPIIHRIVDGTGLRIRLFRTDGTFMYDSQEEPDAASLPPDSISTLWTKFIDAMDGTDLHVYRDLGRSNVTAYPEFAAASQGKPQAMILVSDRGRRTITIVTPIKRRDTLGTMLLSTRDGEIDKLLWAERRTVLWISGIGLLVMAITSLLLAGTIALPLRQLTNAADRVQLNLKRREDLPDYADRGDEIGQLSTTLRSMTEALYKRIESSERFAADVAHELKNPLTSVRSAAETLPRVKNEADRKLLTDTIQNDVKRLTRLIDDISKATRADAEMALNVAEPVDLADLLNTLTEMFNNVHVRDGQRVVADLAPCGLPLRQAYLVQGHDMRLGQVFKNLLDNALSFSSATGKAVIKAQRSQGTIVITVEDDGPGIPASKFEKIFDRFYTDRPEGSFGNNSGLGLSICKEIVIAHGGKIWAENRVENTVQKSGTSDLGVVSTTIAGARFLVELPAAIPLAGHRLPSRLKAHGWR